MKRTGARPIFFGAIIVIVFGILIYHHYKILAIENVIEEIKVIIVGAYYWLGMLFRKIKELGGMTV